MQNFGMHGVELVLVVSQTIVSGAGGGRRLGRFLCQNHPTKSDVTSG